MVGKYLARSGLVMMAILAAAVALYSLRYYGALVDGWLDVDLKIRAVIEQVPIQALTHMLIAPVALLLGPFQFFPRLRAKYPQAHRWSGRVYVVACVVAGGWPLPPQRPAARSRDLASASWRCCGSVRRLAPGAPPCSANSRSIVC